MRTSCLMHWQISTSSLEDMDSPDANDDENLARSAVVEGQASWLMMAYQLRVAGQPAVPTAEMLKSVVDLNDSSSSDYPVLAASPLYVRQSLLFPYTQGTLFFDAVYKKAGKDAFSRVFKTPPSDSAEIYHPERYFSGWKHSKPRLPGLSLQGEWNDVSEGEIGEFDHSLLLWQFCSEEEAKTLGPHLVGGQFRIRASAKSHHPVLLYRSEWDSEHAAREFFGAFEIILQRKWKHCDITTRNATTLSGHSESGYFLATLSDRLVSSLEGLPTPIGPPAMETSRRLASRLP